MEANLAALEVVIRGQLSTAAAYTLGSIREPNVIMSKCHHADPILSSCRPYCVSVLSCTASSYRGLRCSSNLELHFVEPEKVCCYHAGTSVHSFKFAADFDSPLQHILAMSREFDLTHSWNRYVTESVILAEPSIFESTLYAASWLPFPFPDIDLVVAARGIDLAEVSFWLYAEVSCLLPAASCLPACLTGC